jgi:hypothetical protein
MHGQYIRSMDRQLIDEEDTFLWLSWGDLKGDTESEIIATQDQALQTIYHATYIYYKQKYIANRDCKQSHEIVQHIIPECPILAPEQYVKSSDRVCAQKRCNVCKEIGVKLDNKQCAMYHVTKSVGTSHGGTATILWNEQLRTDKLFLTLNQIPAASVV